MGCSRMGLGPLYKPLLRTALNIHPHHTVYSSEDHCMALYTSSLTLPSIPAKIPSSNGCILRTSCAILHHPSSTASVSSKLVPSKTFSNLLRATPPQKYVYPDPIPEFAISETQKFRDELLKKLYKDKDTFGDDLQIVVNVCAESDLLWRSAMVQTETWQHLAMVAYKLDIILVLGRCGTLTQ
ncbi:hypothetical protein TEA_015912 [Camellia sinensis var. sinensis]|uniref:Uncharacterized protein n=1 Tax=Camellia sinensis var. sinensis TaxID=542762 RepID=A0A4S4DF44_CAMSN|nr:hypothetical protein TEA_015912 [Camellia sinensis var. sinensis]